MTILLQGIHWTSKRSGSWRSVRFIWRIVSFMWNSNKVKEFGVVYMRMLFTKQGKQPARSSKRKARVPGPEVTVDTQTMISGNIYQTWLKDPSSLVSKRRRVSSVCQCVIAWDYLFSKMSELMHFTCRIDGCLFTVYRKLILFRKPR
jgi:hypothetical protein